MLETYPSLDGAHLQVVGAAEQKSKMEGQQQTLS